MAGPEDTISVWNDGEDIEYLLRIWESSEAKAASGRCAWLTDEQRPRK